MLEGLIIKIGEVDRTVPPLKLKDLRRLGPKLKELREIDGVPNDEQYETILDVIGSALRRNYPDMSRDVIDDVIDTANMLPLLNAVMNVSGLEKTKGEAARP